MSLTPPVPPKDSRRDQSTLNQGVQKRPPTIVPSRPQTSRRNQAVRGISRSNSFANRQNRDNEDASSWTSRVSSEDDEYDGHTATRVDLAILESALDESIRDSHAELQNRVRSGKNSPTLDQVSQHLLDSPPSSPDSVQGGWLPVPGARLRYAELQKQELEEIMKQDAEFHRMMNDLSAIRQWWKGNKQAWREMREKIRNFDNDIAALQAQMDQHRRMIWNGKSGMSDFYGSTADFLDERWAPQIQELKEQREANLEWFDENRRLMKMVWARVKEMGDRVYMEARDNKKFASSYPATHDISNLSWFQRQDRGLKWWLKQARRDVETLRDKIQTLLDSEHTRARQRDQTGHELKQRLNAIQTVIKGADQEADCQISELQDNKPEGYEAEINRVLETRRNNKIHDVRQEYDLQAMIKDFQTRDQESVLMRKTLADIFERNRQVRRQLNQIYRDPPKINPGSAQHQNAFYTDIYHLVRHHIHRTIQGLDLGAMLYKVSYSQTKREKIIARMEINANTDKAEPFFLDFAARMSPKNGQVDYKSLRSLVQRSSPEARHFVAMVETCQIISGEPEPAFGTHPVSYLVPDVLNVAVDKKQPPGSPFNLTRTMGSNVTLTVAKSILEKSPSEPPGTQVDKNYPWYELLRDFFTSPDIFPLFRSSIYTRSRRSWTKDEFVTYVNNLLKIPLEHHIIESFLVYCSHTGDLFRISEFRRRVSVIPDGWELCEENRVRGIYRKVPGSSLSRPQGIDRLEHVLRRNCGAVEFQNADRNMDEEDLRKFLNQAMPNDHRVSKERMRLCVSYWSNVGEFFVLVSPIDEFRDVFTFAKLLRLDSGFNLPSSLPFLPITAPPPNYDDILAAFQTTSLIPLVQRYGRDGIDERKLYRFLFLGGEKGEMNWEVSRHHFHLFLRWMSQRGNMLKLARNGRIRFLTEEGGASASGSRGGGSANRGQDGAHVSDNRGEGGCGNVQERGMRGVRRDGDDGGVHDHGYERQGWNEGDDDAVSYAGTTWERFIGK